MEFFGINSKEQTLTTTLQLDYSSKRDQSVILGRVLLCDNVWENKRCRCQSPNSKITEPTSQREVYKLTFVEEKKTNKCSLCKCWFALWPEFYIRSLRLIHFSSTLNSVETDQVYLQPPKSTDPAIGDREKCCAIFWKWSTWWNATEQLVRSIQFLLTNWMLQF